MAETGWAKAANAGSPGGDFVVARASWGLWETNSFLECVTHGLNKMLATLGNLCCVDRARPGLAVAATGWTKAAKAGSPGVDFVVARASWGLCRPIVSLKV